MRGAVKLSWEVLLAIVIVALMFLVIYLIVWGDLGSKVVGRTFNIRDLVNLIFKLNATEWAE